ncbi:MAG: nickel pincer cofactor biosynthesis protein LarC [Oscillospiraceae bacterium]|nr:nickel pincer cofactor biosynthesis protein LarC [Oscillospiraceae bacterium]
MRTLYIECNMGAAGDMLLSAFTELVEDPSEFIARLNSAGIPGVVYTMNKASKCGITGTQIEVSVNGAVEDEHLHEHRHEHHHAGMHDIRHIIDHLNVSDTVKRDAEAVYRIIAEAESHAHGKPITEIHFHEVGTMDAVADVVGVCMAIEELSPDRILSSPVHVGSGTVHCAHGILPVPAPATAYILRDVPIYGGSIKGELCTPTGAALLKYFSDDFGAMPVMIVKNTGYGMGHKDFETANCVRAMLGETEDGHDKVIEFRCNIDDMTGEAIGFASQLLLDKGALDVYTIPVGMKKNRPGILLTCMCREEDRTRMLELIFRHTTTIGIREYICNRYTLRRTIKTVNSNYGELHVKESKGWGVTKVKPEYDELERLSRENDIALSDIKPEI